MIDKYRNEKETYPDACQQDYKQQLAWIDSVLTDITGLFDEKEEAVRLKEQKLDYFRWMMEAAAQADAEVIVLDRPNPNGSYVDGYAVSPSIPTA